MGVQPLVRTQPHRHIDSLASVACPLPSPPRLGCVPTARSAVQRVGGCDPAEIRAYARFRRESRPSC
jgi:hypothetical protein